MNQGLKKVIRYLGILLFTGFLLWVSFSNIEVKGEETKFGFIIDIWKSANKPFIILSAIIALMSHLIRAERWKLLLQPIGYPLKSSQSFMSVMVGYFVNMAIPRGGEFSRCYNLYKLNKTPVNVSFGTVISERVVDLLFLLVLITAVFLIQLDLFLNFFNSLDWNQSANGGKAYLILYILFGFAFFILAGLFIFFKSKKRVFLRIVVKTKLFLLGIKSGVFSIFRLEKRGLFILYSILIWMSYYLMNYFVMQAFPATAALDLSAALTIFVIGGIALAIPLPSGAGSYHLLVSAGLTFIYGVANDQALAFSVIVHLWQTLVIIVVGAASLILSQLYYKTQQNEDRK